MTFDIAPYRELYPWAPHFLDVGQGVKLHYLDEGQGETLVMLHGNPTWSFYWRHLVTAFSGTHRVIVPDHVGCGLSDKPGDDRYEYQLKRRVDDLEALLDSLGLQKDLTLVLHDWGGMIGMAFATRHPERVKRLVVLNTAGFGLPEGRSLPWQVGVVRHLPFFPVPVRAFNAFSRGANRWCSTRPGRMTGLVKQAYLAPYDSWAHRIAVQRFVEDIPLAPRRPRAGTWCRASRRSWSSSSRCRCCCAGAARTSSSTTPSSPSGAAACRTARCTCSKTPATTCWKTRTKKSSP